MKGLLANRIIPLVVVAAALVGAMGLAGLRHSVTLAAGKPMSLPRIATVKSVVRACTAPGLAKSPASGVAVMAAPSGAGTGRAVAERLGAAGRAPLRTLTRPGALAQAPVRAVAAAPARKGVPSPAPTAGPPAPTQPAPGGVVIQASGAMAQGLEVEQVAAGGGRSARCESPGTDFWFVGPGRYSVARIQLYFLNADSQAAVVNVEGFTDAGPLQGSADTGISVPPRSMVTQSVGGILHGSRVVALHVRTSEGQVVAAAEEMKGPGRGGAWLPPAQPPATRVIVPGLPATAGTRQLFVAVPGTQDARVVLSATTSRGSYQPTGGGALDIPGGSAVAISLSSLAGIPGALKLSANVPITAAVMLPGGQPGAPGVFTAASWPVDQQGVVAYNESGAGRGCELVLSAPRNQVRVRIAEVGAGGPMGTAKVVAIRPRHTKVVQLGRSPGSGRRSVFAVVITPLPGSGPLYAARVLTSGGVLLAILPVPSALTRVALPAVRNALITPAR